MLIGIDFYYKQYLTECIFLMCTNCCRTQRLLHVCMTGILMCEGAVNKGILEKKNYSWMQVLRDPNINGTYTFTYMLKSSFIHSLFKIVMLCLISLGLQTT